MFDISSLITRLFKSDTNITIHYSTIHTSLHSSSEIQKKDPKLICYTCCPFSVIRGVLPTFLKSYLLKQKLIFGLYYQESEVSVLFHLPHFLNCSESPPRSWQCQQMRDAILGPSISTRINYVIHRLNLKAKLLHENM